MFIKNFCSNREIHEWYKDHPLLSNITEHEKYWIVLFTDGTFYLCEKDENFVSDEFDGILSPDWVCAFSKPLKKD